MVCVEGRGEAVAPAAVRRRWLGPATRLGFATRLVGAPLRAHDSRRWAQGPHLSVSLAYLRDILTYLEQARIRFYRLSSNLAPYATHPALPAFHRQLEECLTELADVGDRARAAGVRLTMHPAQHVRLDAADAALAERSLAELALAAALLDAMGVGCEGVLVVHPLHGRAVEGESGAEAALARFARRVEQLDASVRRRLVIENGDRTADLCACLWLHRRTGLPVVLDVLHHRCHNPSGLPLDAALAAALATWPAGVVPKVHLSSPRTELRLLRRGGGLHLAAPLPAQHSDFVNPFECIDLLRSAERQGLRPFDLMLEAKAHDLAVLRLRDQLAAFAPDLAASVA